MKAKILFPAIATSSWNRTRREYCKSHSQTVANFATSGLWITQR